MEFFHTHSRSSCPGMTNRQILAVVIRRTVLAHGGFETLCYKVTVEI